MLFLFQYLINFLAPKPFSLSRKMFIYMTFSKKGCEFHFLSKNNNLAEYIFYLNIYASMIYMYDNNGESFVYKIQNRCSLTFQKSFEIDFINENALTKFSKFITK